MGLEEKLPQRDSADHGREGRRVRAQELGVARHLRPGLLRDRAVQTAGPRHDLARFGMERVSNTPRQADLMIVAGRVSQKMAPVLRQIYDQMADPKWVISMGVCASSGGMFNNYAIVQGVDHIVPGRHLPARLPAPAGDAAGRDPQAARQDPEHEARRQPGAPDHRTGAGPAAAAAAGRQSQRAPGPHRTRAIPLTVQAVTRTATHSNGDSRRISQPQSPLDVLEPPGGTGDDRSRASSPSAAVFRRPIRPIAPWLAGQWLTLLPDPFGGRGDGCS